MNRLTQRWIFLGGVLFYVNLSIVKHHPLWVEHYYEGLLYPLISTLNQWLWGWLPFSVGDIGYFIALVFGVRSLRKFSLRRHYWKGGSIIAVVVVLFYTSWGVHYFKTPMREKRQLSDTISIEQLNNATTYYAKKLAVLHNKLTSTPEEKVVVDASTQNILGLASQTMEETPLRPEKLHGKAKATLFPTLLSYMGFGGYFNPFTHEAQVNTLQPKLRILTTACHEIAHQWGYAAEDEANYISIKATTQAENPLVAYAGNLLAFQYLINTLSRNNKDNAKEIVATLPKGVLENIREVRNFWLNYQNPFEVVFEKSYDQYLKANHQQEGIKSYSLVVSLLVDDVVNLK